MAFSFGASASGAPSAGAPSSGTSSFSFGGNSSNAPATAGFGTTSTPAPPPGGAFSFGNASAAPPPSFGSSPSPGTPAPAFGLGHPAVQNSNAPSTGGLFGGSSAAPSSTGSGYGNQTPATSLALTSPSTSVFTVPEFSKAFPHIQLLSKIRDLDEKLTTGDKYVAQELLQLVQEEERLSNPPAPSLSAPNHSIRQQLQQNPHVELFERQAALTPQMLQEVFQIADDLFLSEELAMAVYAQASQLATRQFLQESSSDKNILYSARKAASELFFMHQSALLKGILMLCQCRLQHKLLEATDVLLKKALIGNLVTLIQKLTELTGRLEQQIQQQQSNMSSRSTMLDSNDNKRTWLDHLYHERQVAAECLFYLTYSTQSTASEIASLIDLVQGLTNDGLAILDPVKDVPDAYVPQPHAMQWGAPFTQPLPPLQEKNVRDWEQELVQKIWQKKEPHVLQCTSILVMAILCGLDTKQQLLNRETSRVNDFGVGNALFRSLDQHSSFDPITPIHQRLYGDTAVQQWKRKDIWGVLAAAYALSLRPVSAVVASPRAQSHPSGVKSVWKACLAAPSDHKSFTFVRLSLMPAITDTSKRNKRCELHEFLLSVLSEFLSNYLDVVCASNAIPPSRSRWLDNEMEGLKMQREEQDRARSFYQSYGDASYQPQDDVPTEVNLLNRPDCIDDIVAVAIAVSSQGPNYAGYFWSREEYHSDDGSLQTRPIPSRALKKMELLQDRDSSLIPAYVSFLGALAIAEPCAIFDLMNTTNEENKAMTWRTLFSTLRWYVRKMSDGYTGDVRPSNANTDTSGAGYSSYYYGTEDYGEGGGLSSVSTTGESSQSNSSTKLKELGEMNTTIVISHLALVAKVAANYATGRALLASMKLSLDDSEEGDPVLVVLFSLAIAPLVPHVRGAVFATLAALFKLDGANTEEEILIRDMARKGWDLLELSQAVPVLVLDQYQRKEFGAFTPPMTYPPSSISIANSGSKQAWLPADPKFGILFEMEHVESSLGYYPATEGLLQLLTSLVSSAGCPADLGQSTETGKIARLRPGCTPYIEYVVSFVIPRALGLYKAHDKLPFRSGVDSSRLVARSLEVIEAVLTRYAVPLGEKGATFADELKHQKQLMTKATSLMRLPHLTETLMLPPTESELTTFKLDFESKKTLVPISDKANASVSLPQVKSPGFIILADLLSPSDSELLRGLALVLTEDGGCEGVHSVYGQLDYQYRISWALFGDTIPSLATAKYKQENASGFLVQSLILPLLPPIDVSGDLNDSKDSIYWKIKSITTALRILGAAAVREQEFTLQAGITTIVPVLQFKASTSVVLKKESHLTTVRDSLAHSMSPRVLPAVAQYLVSVSSDDDEDSEISGTALGLLVYCFAKSSVSASFTALDAQSVEGEIRFSSALAARFDTSSKRTGRKVDADITRVVLSLLQSEMSDVLLGFPHKSVDGLDAPGISSRSFVSKPTESLSVLMSRLNDEEFITNPSSSGIASTCFALIYGLILSSEDPGMGKQRGNDLASRLNAADFWNTVAMRFLAVRDCGEQSMLASAIEKGIGSNGVENVLHGAAYFFDALAVHCVKKAQILSEDSLSNQNQRLLSNLLDKHYHLLCNALDCMPLIDEGDIASFPQSLLSFDTVVTSCMVQMTGQYEHVAGYLLVDVADLKAKISPHEKKLGGAIDECVKWAQDWNDYAQWDCAASHLSRATMHLIEASLEYSKWSLQSGISNLLHSSNELGFAREHCLLVLLDQMIDRLVGPDEPVTPMSSRLLKSASTNVCAEVLLLAERLLSSASSRSHLSHFVNRIGLATMSSLLKVGSGENLDVEDEERAVMLGSAMAQLLDSDSDEIQERVQDVVCHVAASFSDLCCRNVNLEAAGDELELRQAKISMMSRSILSSLIGSLDTYNTGGTNPVVTTLATTTSPMASSKTALQALVQVITTLDNNICIFLGKIASSEGGAALLINAGVMKALADAAQNYKAQTNSKPAMAFLDVEGPPSYLSSNLWLLRVILSSESISDEARLELLVDAQKLLISYSEVINRIGEAFPLHGDLWLDIVSTLASATRIEDNGMKHITFVSSRRKEPTFLSSGLDKLVAYVISVTTNLIEYPFPERFQPALPQKLCVQQPGSVWWDSVEQRFAANAIEQPTTFPGPPTGLTFGRSSFAAIDITPGDWSPQKYEACLAAAQVVDASLTFLLERLFDESAGSISFPIGSLARGLCRFTDSSRAITQRLSDIQDFSKDSTMDVGAFDSISQESMHVEKVVLEEIRPIFGQCCEKLLMLGHKIFSKMSALNDESYRGMPSTPSRDMKEFADLVHLALLHTRLATMGVTSSPDHTDRSGSEFSKVVAEKLEKDLSNVLT